MSSRVYSNSANNKDTSGYHIRHPLKTVYSSCFPIGAAVAANEFGFSSFSRYSDDILGVFNSYTAEDCMKPEVIHPGNNGDPSDYNWTHADQVVRYASSQKALIRGHVLIWHKRTLPWMTTGTKAVVRNIMKDHISTVVNRYKENIYCWDVVSEAILDNGEFRTDSPWYTAFGDTSYIQHAFDYAYAADNKCQLFYIDYNVAQPAKRQAIVNMINNLDLIKNHHLYGIGIQAHWSLTWPSTSEIQTTIDTFKALGLKIHISELDINCYNSSEEKQVPLTPDLQSRLNTRYCELFRLFRKNAGVIENVTFWGVADDHTWLNTYSEGEPCPFRQNYPMPFTSDHKVKDFYIGITDF